jgi:hemerythrin
MQLHLSTALLVGVAEIDRQHEELFRRQNGLRASLSETGQSEVTRAMTYLQSYAAHHFGTEEAWMLRTRYPGYDVHRSEHQTFLEAIGGCRDRLIAIRQSPDDLLAMERQIAGWLVRHITTSDQPLGLFLRKLATASDGGRSRRASHCGGPKLLFAT